MPVIALGWTPVLFSTQTERGLDWERGTEDEDEDENEDEDKDEDVDEDDSSQLSAFDPRRRRLEPEDTLVELQCSLRAAPQVHLEHLCAVLRGRGLSLCESTSGCETQSTLIFLVCKAFRLVASQPYVTIASTDAAQSFQELP